MPCGAFRGLVVVGAPSSMSPPLAVRRATMAACACLVIVGGGACRVRFPCNARLGLVVEGVLVVGPFVDLVGLSRASGRYSPRARA